MARDHPGCDPVRPDHKGKFKGGLNDFCLSVLCRFANRHQARLDQSNADVIATQTQKRNVSAPIVRISYGTP